MDDLDATYLLQTQICDNVYKIVNQSVLHFTDAVIVWIEDPHEENVSFDGMVQVYTDKTATALKANDIIAYPVLWYPCLLRARAQTQWWPAMVRKEALQVGGTARKSLVW